jgi:hypothetical protein
MIDSRTVYYNEENTEMWCKILRCPSWALFIPFGRIHQHSIVLHFVWALFFFARFRHVVWYSNHGYLSRPYNSKWDHQDCPSMWIMSEGTLEQTNWKIKFPIISTYRYYICGWRGIYVFVIIFIILQVFIEINFFNFNIFSHLELQTRKPFPHLWGYHPLCSIRRRSGTDTSEYCI